MTPFAMILEQIEKGSLDGLKALGDTLPRAVFADETDTRFARTPLHWAARNNRPEIVRWLVSSMGASLEAQDIDGSRPLHVAAMRGSAEAASVLLELGAEPDAPRRDGKTPFIFAQSQTLAGAGAAHKSVAEMLARAGARVEAQDGTGMTAVGLAQQMGQAARRPVQPLASRAATDSPLARAMTDEFERAQRELGTLDDSGTSDALAPKEALAQGAPTGSVVMPRAEALRKLVELGFETLGAQDGEPPLIGRAEAADDVATLLDKGKSVMIVGKAGVGKRGLARAAAERLAGRGKIVMSVPSARFRGTKYAGSVNENMQQWIGPALALGDELVLFVNDAHQLATGKTSSDSADTPLQILREQLDPRKARHLTLLCASTPREMEPLKEDESFMALFAQKTLDSMSPAEALAALLSDAGRRALLRDYPEADAQAFERLAHLSVELGDKYLFNLPFPFKGFDFCARALAVKAPQAWSADELTDLFCKEYSVPQEIARGRLTADSPYYKLEDALNAKLVGQAGPIREASEAISSQIVLANPQSHRPVSMLFAGPTGVGKTEASVTIAQTLGLPILEISMGEYKTAQQVVELRSKVVDFCSKHYAGVMLFDEIEKSNPSVRDLLLNLFDKGSVGSGDDKVDCGFMICIATTNVGAQEAVDIKRTLRALDGDPKIHDSWIRDKLVEEGFRPEFVNRIGLACDFNDITRPDALKIATLMFASQAKGLKASRGIDLTIDESVAREHAADVFDPAFGARGIRRCVDATLARIVAQRDLALAVGPGSKIEAASVQGVITARATSGDGVVTVARIEPKDDARDLMRLRQAMASLSSFGDVVGSAARCAAAPAPSTPRPPQLAPGH